MLGQQTKGLQEAGALEEETSIGEQVQIYLHIT